jgi:hypothetical protein
MRAASELAMRSGLWLQQADSCGNIFKSIHDRFEVFVNLGGFVPVAPSVMGSLTPR